MMGRVDISRLHFPDFPCLTLAGCRQNQGKCQKYSSVNEDCWNSQGRRTWKKEEGGVGILNRELKTFLFPLWKEKREWAPLDSVLTPSKGNSAPRFKAPLSFLFLPISNLWSEFEGPKSWEYLQVTSTGTPWLEGSDSQVEVRINSENSHLSSALPAPPWFQQLLHQDR